MAFLLGKRTRSLSIEHPLGVRNDTQVLPIEKLSELKTRVIAGDATAVDEMVKAHIKLAIHIAGQYAVTRPPLADDLVSEAMLGCTIACSKLSVKVKDENITNFIAAKVHDRCVKFVQKDGILRIPEPTARRHKKNGTPIQAPVSHELLYAQPGSKAPKEKQWLFLHPKMCVESDAKAAELRDILKQAIKSVRQKEIVELSMEGYDVREVAAKLNISKSVVSRELQAVREEVKRMSE